MSQLELEAQFKDKKYLQLQLEIKLHPGIESIKEQGKSKLEPGTMIEERKNKIGEKSKLITKVNLKDGTKKENEEIPLKIEIFSSKTEVKYPLEKSQLKKITEIRKMPLKIENKDINIFSSETEVKYSLEKSKLNTKINLENEEITLKIKIFSSETEVKYPIEKEENIKFKDELNKENIIHISNHKSTEKNNNRIKNKIKNNIIILFLFIFSLSSIKLEKRREETYDSRGSAANKNNQR